MVSLVGLTKMSVRALGAHRHTAWVSLTASLGHVDGQIAAHVEYLLWLLDSAAVPHPTVQ